MTGPGGTRELTVTVDVEAGALRFDWRGGGGAERGILTPASDSPLPRYRTLDWAAEPAGIGERDYCGEHGSSSSALVRRIRQGRPVPDAAVHVELLSPVDVGPAKARTPHAAEFPPADERWRWVTRIVGDFARLSLQSRGTGRERGRRAAAILTRVLLGLGPAGASTRRSERAAPPARRTAARQDEERAESHAPAAPIRPTAPSRPAPAVAVRVQAPALEFGAGGGAAFELREKAALWWISNQTDDLLCWPYCRIERLEYQVRSALRVLGPLRGRALLSDEVGLGKTIEAGLVAKELLIRGMIRRFLVLTTASLVEQWREELRDKFGLEAASPQGAPERFWPESGSVVASLSLVKQPGQLLHARAQHWDLLIVDEAHHIRNRESQAWQAVNALPRQYLLLLTATPVQNSIDELYNLVTLLRPGQLPAPAEFRARFIDPKRPRQPKEPEELRRLLGQLMIRNTRASCGVNLPPRRAQTVLVETPEAERIFHDAWTAELRRLIAGWSGGAASLWGRLLLQAAGSSPAAWKGALEKFPDPAAAARWADQADESRSWARKCELLAPLAQGEGGVVVFTQYRRTQEALAQRLQERGTPAISIHGGTPTRDRQELAEEFRRRGGALILTPSGTEGRNLQFCRRLANFDLPWNPMVIEQRIGRLHRIGQLHPVEIYNFVQEGTLQAELLLILQEKLNLFELVVGETGLILGDRLSGEEFAEEVLARWRAAPAGAPEPLRGLGEELTRARERYREVQELDGTLFAEDYEA